MASMRDRVTKSKVKYRNNKLKNYGIYLVVVVMFLIGFMGVLGYVNKYKKEVTLLSFNQPIASGMLVEESFMSPLVQAEKNYQDGMILWKDREEFIGKYSAHYIRNSTPTYQDMYVDEQPLKTPYLYNLEPDQELLTFPYDISTAGGRLVVPGDRLRVRGSYAIKVSPSEEGIVDKVEERSVAETIFDVVEVQDLLNGSNESIVDIINKANRLSQKEKEDLMSTSEFIDSVTPRAILMVANNEEIDNYVEFEANENPKYTITMLSRNEELQTDELYTGNSLWNLLDQMKQDSAVME